MIPRLQDLGCLCSTLWYKCVYLSGLLIMNDAGLSTVYQVIYIVQIILYRIRE